eukprot:4053278-Prymnesium_polylepis.1
MWNDLPTEYCYCSRTGWYLAFQGARNSSLKIEPAFVASTWCTPRTPSRARMAIVATNFVVKRLVCVSPPLECTECGLQRRSEINGENDGTRIPCAYLQRLLAGPGGP